MPHPLNKINHISKFNLKANDFIVPKNHPILNEYYLHKNPLGTGSYAEVMVCVHRLTNIERAVKIINKNKMNIKERSRMYQEIKILKQLDHPNIVKIFDFYDDDDYMYIVTELCSGGELFDMITKIGSFTE